MIQADFHVHSRYSFDSFLSPRSIAKTALKKELSVIAVADHNTTEGALKTIEEAASTSLRVIPAIELETDGGHVMGLFVESNIVAKSIDEVLDEITEQGGISVLLHPARMCGSKLKEAACKVDVIEALNGRTRRCDNLKAQDLAFKFNKPVVAGSDAHLRFEIGCVRTIFDASSSNFEDLRKLIINGHRTLAGRESSYVVHVFSFGTQIVKSSLRLA
jgi:predicted metal-dependent phosphoesterase TrpH